jgi:hypothetical protein
MQEPTRIPNAVQPFTSGYNHPFLNGGKIDERSHSGKTSLDGKHVKTPIACHLPARSKIGFSLMQR